MNMIHMLGILSTIFFIALFLLCFFREKLKTRLTQQLADTPTEVRAAQTGAMPESTEEEQEKIAAFQAGLSQLTPKERELYGCYIDGLTTDIIMEKLAIKENTLKFHNKNLYSKLGVSSRKQLMEIHKAIQAGQ